MEVAVLAWLLAWVDVGWLDEPGHACLDLDVPFFVVDQMVVVAAQQDTIVDTAWSTPRPVLDVVGFAPRGRHGARRERAAFVPGGNGLTDVRREDPGGPADVQHLPVTAEDDGNDVGVAGDLPQRGRRDRAGERKAPRAALRPAGAPGLSRLPEERELLRVFQRCQELPVIDGGHDLGALASGRRQCTGGEGNLAGAQQPVQEFLRPRAAVQGRGIIT